MSKYIITNFTYQDAEDEDFEMPFFELTPFGDVSEDEGFHRSWDCNGKVFIPKRIFGSIEEMADAILEMLNNEADKCFDILFYRDYETEVCYSPNKGIKGKITYSIKERDYEYEKTVKYHFNFIDITEYAEAPTKINGDKKTEDEVDTMERPHPLTYYTRGNRRNRRNATKKAEENRAKSLKHIKRNGSAYIGDRGNFRSKKGFMFGDFKTKPDYVHYKEWTETEIDEWQKGNE
jgi:hypothetical protein